MDRNTYTLRLRLQENDWFNSDATLGSIIDLLVAFIDYQIDDAETQAYHDGSLDGHQEGYDQGYDQGYDTGYLDADNGNG